MKNTFLALLALVFFANSCKQAEIAEGNEGNKKILEKIIVDKARKYGLEDSVDLYLRIDTGKPLGPNVDASIEAYEAWVDTLFARNRANINKNTIFKRFMQERMRVNSIKAYYDLLEQKYPSVLAEEVKMANGRENYEKKKQDFLTPGKWSLYLDKRDSALVFWPSSEGVYTGGTRLDK